MHVDRLQGRAVSAWDDDGDPGPDGSLADDQGAVAPDDGGVADRHARDVGDGVVRPGGATTDPDPEISCSHRERVAARERS